MKYIMFFILVAMLLDIYKEVKVIQPDPNSAQYRAGYQCAIDHCLSK